MAAQFTNRQGQFLAYIDAFIRRRKQSPSEVEIADHFGVSPPTAHQMVVALENRGLIDRTPGVPRSIRVLVPVENLPGSEYGLEADHNATPFAASYPVLASWIMGKGWVELGMNDCNGLTARALDEHGLIWQGNANYNSVDDLLLDLNGGIAAWVREHTP